MSKHNDVHTIENAKGGNKGGFKRHCARKWWIYVIAFIVIALAGILGLIFGILPKIAQKTVNDSVLTVQGVSITKPSNDKFTYAQNSTVKGHVPVKAHFNPQRIAMFVPTTDGSEPTPFMYLNVSSLDVSDEFHIDINDYPMGIANQDAFLNFTKSVLGKEKVTLGLKSRPELVSGSLKNYVNYYKEVTLNGFNGLAGITIYNSSVLSEPEADGTNMLANLFIPNKSDFTLEVGDLTANFAAQGLGDLGYGIVKNLVLNKGDNDVIIRAVLSPKVYANKGIVAAIPLGGLPVTVVGNNTKYDGQSVTWLETPLKELPLTVPNLGKGKTPYDNKK